MILRLTCPKCSKDSYSASVEKFKPCPYCGVLFSGKYGSEKRRHTRVKKEIPLSFTHQGRRIEACTVDVSHDGLCVKIDGSRSLPVGDTVDVTLHDSRLKAQVMWAAGETESPSALNGLKLIDSTLNSL